VNTDTDLPLKLCLNLDRRTDRRSRAAEMFRMHRLKVDRWSALDGRKARHARGWENLAQRAMCLSLASMVRRARKEKAKGVLVFEDDVILHEDFRERVAALEVPDDWALLYFGCLHMSAPVRQSPGLVRLAKAYSTHAIAIRDQAYGAVLDALRVQGVKGLRPEAQPADVLLTSLHTVLPCYAAFPNLAWQRESASDIADCDYNSYSPTGEQLFMTEVLKDFV